MDAVRLMVLQGVPDEIVVVDEPEVCPYLPDQLARMPLRLPVRALSPEETDARFEQGDRRHGRLLYAPQCSACCACEPIRIDVARFEPRGTHRRVLRRGDEALRVELGPPEVCSERLALYEKHKRGRGLVTGAGQLLDEKGYFGFLVDRCVDSVEVRYWLGGALVGVAVADRGSSSLSAVYCYYDPDHPKLSIGTYSILKQIELAREWGMRFVYLGLFIADNAHMRYKARFMPHERRIDGRWQSFGA